MNKKTVLVTGGAGYIGSHTCKTLALAGYFPVAYDNLKRGFASAVNWGPLEQGDVLDKRRLEEVCRRYRPDAVIHFAALAYVGESVLQPEQYWRNNVAGSLCLVETMLEQGIRKIVFSSTCAVYGEPCDDAPIVESTRTRPVNPYGVTKLAVEQILDDCAIAHELSALSLRYFNAAGADIAGEIGESHDPETHLIPLILQSALNQNQPMTVFGSDYSTPDGSCIRDYIHVADLATAHIQSLEYLAEKPGSHRMNLGTGRGYSVLELIDVVSKVTGIQPNFRLGERRPGDPPILVSNASRAEAELGWRPDYPAIEATVESAWRWINRNQDQNPAE